MVGEEAICKGYEGTSWNEGNDSYFNCNYDYIVKTHRVKQTLKMNAFLCLSKIELKRNYA